MEPLDCRANVLEKQRREKVIQQIFAVCLEELRPGGIQGTARYRVAADSGNRTLSRLSGLELFDFRCFPQLLNEEAVLSHDH